MLCEILFSQSMVLIRVLSSIKYSLIISEKKNESVAFLKKKTVLLIIASWKLNDSLDIHRNNYNFRLPKVIKINYICCNGKLFFIKHLVKKIEGNERLSKLLLTPINNLYGWKFKNLIISFCNVQVWGAGMENIQTCFIHIQLFMLFNYVQYSNANIFIQHQIQLCFLVVFHWLQIFLWILTNIHSNSYALRQALVIFQIFLCFLTINVLNHSIGKPISFTRK